MKKIKTILHNIRFLCNSRLSALSTKSIVKTDIPCPCFIDEHVSIQNCVLSPFTNFAHHSDIMNSSIGLRSSIGRYTIVRNSDIGSYCSISWHVTIGADGHPTERVSGHAAFFQKRFGIVDSDSSKGKVPRTIIGNDVLIGCGAIIKAGVTIGNGAVIGAGSVVVKDVPSYAIVLGDPAHVLRYRFNNETIRLLQELEWWNLNDEFLIQYASKFQQPATIEILQELLERAKTGKDKHYIWQFDKND